MPDDLKTLNTQEAAKFLNAHVETIRRLARKGSIPSFKIGKDWRFRQEDLIEWTRSHYGKRLPTILTIDDDPNIREIIRRALEKVGYRVIEAANGAEGIARLRDESVSLILLDLEMPEMNGVEFLDALRMDGIEVPVVLVTGYPDSHLMTNAMRYSPLLLIPKPFDQEHLLRTVKSVI